MSETVGQLLSHEHPTQDIGTLQLIQPSLQAPSVVSLLLTQSSHDSPVSMSSSPQKDTTLPHQPHPETGCFILQL